MFRPSDLPDVGVAVTFSAALLDTLVRHADLVDAIEIEPQTLWSEHPNSAVRYRSNPDVDEILVDLPFRKLVHSIGLPVGGSLDHDPAQVGLLKEVIERVGSPWFSEHLNFNHGPEGFTGFFLPPRQTVAGIDQCAASVRTLRQAIGRPMAIETGVNYLRQRSDEIADGAFTAMVAEQAECGLLLDLHNIYTNERNGRQTMEEFVGQLDLDRVIEVHVAGGMELDGFWLDAHSGAMPDDLIGRAHDIIGSLPNLHAVTFEIYPAFIGDLEEAMIVDQLEVVRSLWENRGRDVGHGAVSHRAASHRTASHGATPQDLARVARVAPIELNPVSQGPDPVDWERDLAAMVTARDTSVTDDYGLRSDPGLALLQRLSLEFRASMITTNLPRTIRLMLLAVGEDVVRMFLDEFRRTNPPNMFSATEAVSFARFLEDLDVNIPQLDLVLRFEVAALQCRIDGETRVVQFGFDPFPMLRALAEHRLPDQISEAGDYEIEITA